MPYRRRYKTTSRILQEGYMNAYKPKTKKPRRRKRRRRDPDEPRKPREPVPIKPPARKKRDGNRQPVRNPYLPTRGSPIDTINNFIRRSIRNPYGPLGRSNAIRNLPFPNLTGIPMFPKWIPKL